MSIFFCILVTSYNAFSSVVTKVYEEEGEYTLGPYSILMVYLFFMIGNFFASSGRNFGEKWVMIFSSIGAIFLPFSAIEIRDIPTWASYAITAALIIPYSFGSSFFYVAASSYIHKTAHLYGKEEQKGKYYGIFNFIMNLNMLFGGVIVTFGLPQLTHIMYYGLVSLIAFSSLVFGILFMKDLRRVEPSEEEEVEVIEDEAEKESVFDCIK